MIGKGEKENKEETETIKKCYQVFNIVRTTASDYYSKNVIIEPLDNLNLR